MEVFKFTAHAAIQYKCECEKFTLKSLTNVGANEEGEGGLEAFLDSKTEIPIE